MAMSRRSPGFGETLDQWLVAEGLVPADGGADALADVRRVRAMLIAAARESDRAAIAYLASFDSGQPVVGFTGPPDIQGRFHYDPGLTGFNFEGARVGLSDFLARIRASLD
ncbi:hypothetical protein, partial [Staphylococcus aureus]|uniref:hypothetical protein n=1 Tax=Staphylococcus aureus TaxID=1280 RepID=UPI00190F267C